MSSEKKSVIFCTYSSIYSSLVLEQLLQNDEIDVVAIINSSRVLKPSYGQLWGTIQQIRTAGLSYSTYLFLITDVFTLLTKMARSSLPTVQQMARDYEVPFYETKDINNQQTKSYLTQLSPDYILAAHFNQLIKPEVLRLPEIACINIHPSLLPAYKGVDPVFYAMLAGEKKLGVSLHKMSESFDTGELISQKSLPLEAQQTLFDMNCRLFIEGGRLALNRITQGATMAQETPLNTGHDSYDSWPTPAKVRLFKKTDRKLIRLKSLWQRVMYHEV